MASINAAETILTDDDFRSLERARLRALVERNIALAETLHSPDFHLVTPRGNARSRESYLRAVELGEIRYLKWEPEAILVRRFDKVALLRYQAELEMPAPSGEPDSFRCWHTDSYELHGGFWSVVWSQATLIR
jgi:hypothetical protein